MSHAGGRPRRAEDRWTDSRGFVQVRVGDHVVPEHRLVMMAMLGRPLLPGEQVKFRNGDRGDTSPGNLELRVALAGAHAASIICPSCGAPWIDRDPTELAVPLQEARERIESGVWALSPQEAASEFPDRSRNSVSGAGGRAW